MFRRIGHGVIGESRRDRLRRILKKLLSDRKEVAVPVAVPVLPTVPGQEVKVSGTSMHQFCKKFSL
jgi:hypothetical protein